MSLIRASLALLRRRLLLSTTTIVFLIFVLVLSTYNNGFTYVANIPAPLQTPLKNENSQAHAEDEILKLPLQDPSFPVEHDPAAVPRVTSPWRKIAINHPVQTQISLPPPSSYHTLHRIQHNFAVESISDERVRLGRQATVKRTFEKCWTSYKNRAWMKDELSPISGGSRNLFGGWSATLVDSLDTLFIMEMHGELEEAITASAQIDFTESSDEVLNLFETTIRYLGGFLGAYDLTGNHILLEKAIEVGEMLLVAFDTPNHMPIARWNWVKTVENGALNEEASAGMLVSELGSFTLEFTRLSQITNDMRWYDAVARITNLFESQQQSTNLPGMWPVSINAKDMVLDYDSWFTLGGMSDSLYEYFPKSYALLGGQEPVYEKLYRGSMVTSIEHLFFRPMVPNNDDILISGNMRAESSVRQRSLDPQGQHLGCFTGGMLALGGRLFDIPEHITIGRKLTDGCIWAYNASKWGIMPEAFHLVPCNSEGEEPCEWDRKKWEAFVLQRADKEDRVEAIIAEKSLVPGFTDIGDKRYILRPEAIESIFILYRITGDKVYQDAAWQMWTAISNLTETSFANAAIIDVTSDKISLDDRMESFWMAETLKYFYLIFSEPDLISLDEFVLNTEAHPLGRPR